MIIFISFLYLAVLKLLIAAPHGRRDVDARRDRGLRRHVQQHGVEAVAGGLSPAH